MTKRKKSNTYSFARVPSCCEELNDTTDSLADMFAKLIEAQGAVMPARSACAIIGALGDTLMDVLQRVRAAQDSTTDGDDWFVAQATRIVAGLERNFPGVVEECLDYARERESRETPPSGSVH